MPSHVIRSVHAHDLRFALPEGAGSDAVHSESEYCLAVTGLQSDRGQFTHPAVVENGVYRTPQEPGCSSDLLALTPARRSVS